MNIKNLFLLLIPYYGNDVRFRLYLRLREFYRKKAWWFFAKCLKSKLQHKYGCELSIRAQIDPKVSFMHTVGVVIGEGCVVESGVIIFSGVVLGRKDIAKDEYPIVRGGAVLCTGCCVLGKVEVGNNCVIGAHSVVLSDCEEGETYIGAPAKKHNNKT